MAKANVAMIERQNLAKTQKSRKGFFAPALLRYGDQNVNL